MNKKLIIISAVGITVVLLAGLIFINNYITNQELEKQKSLSLSSLQFGNLRDEAEPEFLPYSFISKLTKSNFTKRLVDGGEVYSFEQQEVLNNSLQDYYEKDGVSCNTTKCMVVAIRGDAIQVNPNVIYITSFSLKGVDYWVTILYESDKYSVNLSKSGFMDTKEFKFENKIKNIAELGTEQGLLEIQYETGKKETLDLKTKI
jgi:hypothetical protein